MHFCTRNYGLRKIRHHTPLTEVNNAVDGGPLFFIGLPRLTVDASDAIHYKAQAPLVRFVTVYLTNVLV